MIQTKTLLVVVAALLASQPVVAQEWQPGTDYTVKEIMAAMVQPATDALWNPSSDFDDMGNPLLPTDEEGLNRLRWAAITLGASATAMNAPGQLVDVPGTPAADATLLSADEMNGLKENQYATWVAFSRQLEMLAAEYEAAIDSGDSEAFGWAENALGSKMNNICTACHTVFWYPNAPAPY